MLNYKTRLKNSVKYLLWNLKILFGKWEYQVYLETTSFCNAKCSFCCNSSLKRQKSTMTDEVFQRVLDEIKKAGIKIYAFSLHLNGEPLIDKNIVERIKTIRQEFPASWIRFTSNFSLATPELSTKLLNSGLDEITISLNSINPEEYNEIMGGGGGIDYHKTLDNINTLLELKEKHKSKLKITISMVVGTHNADTIDAFKQTWEGRCDFRFMRLGQWVNKDVPENYIPKPEKIYCNFIHRTISVLSNGDYALCHFDAEGIIHKNIITTPVKKCFLSGVYREIRKYHRKHGVINPECVNCGFMYK